MKRIRDFALGLILVMAVWVAERTLMAQGYETHKEKPMPPTGPLTKAWRIALILALGIIASNMLLCMTGCYVPYTAVIYSNTEQDQAQTRCDVNGEPIVYLSQKDSTSLDLTSIMAHEYEHVRRARAFRGGCRALVQKYNTDRTYMLDEEAAAYCAEAKVFIARGSTPSEAFAKVLYELLNAPAAKNWPPADVEQHMPCHWLKFVQLARLDSTGRRP